MNLDFIKELILAQLNAQILVAEQSKKEVEDAIKTLEGYKVDLETLIANLEELKKKFNSGQNTAVRIVFFEITGSAQKEIIMANIKVTEKKVYGFVAKDSFGNVAVVEAPLFSLSDPALGDLVASADGMSVELTPKGAVGSAELQLKCDAKIGPDELILEGKLPLEFLPGDAVTIELKEILPA